MNAYKKHLNPINNYKLMARIKTSNNVIPFDLGCCKQNNSHIWSQLGESVSGGGGVEVGGRMATYKGVYV